MLKLLYGCAHCASKVTLKILQARFQQYMNQTFTDVQIGFRKGRGTTDQTANNCWIIEKSREFQRKIYFCFSDNVKTSDCVDHNKLWRNLEETGIPDHLICLLRNWYEGQEATVRTGHGTMESSKLEKEYIKAVYCHPAYSTSMKSISWETLSWKKHKLESRLPGEIEMTSDMQMTPPLWKKVKRNYKDRWWKCKMWVKKLALSSTFKKKKKHPKNKKLTS